MKVCGASHVDVEECPPHQEVRSLGGDVLGKLGKALRRDYSCQTTLPTSAHEVGHGAKAGPPNIVIDLTANSRREYLGFVNDDDGWVPVIPVRIEKRRQELCRAAHLPFLLQPFKA